MDGIAKAKERGVAFGRKSKLTGQQLTLMREKRNKGVLIKELMTEYNLSKATVYRYLQISADTKIHDSPYLLPHRIA